MLHRSDNDIRPSAGYSLVEMLIVTGLLLIIATMPIALLRRSREKVYEVEAIRALNMMSMAYENYYAQYGHRYPNYLSDGTITEDVEFSAPEPLWDQLRLYSLVPHRYSRELHDRRDLFARGYRMSIYPADYGVVPGMGYRNTYAIAMIPYEGSIAKRGLVVIQGPRMFSNYPGPLPRKIGRTGRYSISIYILPD